jgi:hypothetical protein
MTLEELRTKLKEHAGDSKIFLFTDQNQIEIIKNLADEFPCFVTVFIMKTPLPKLAFRLLDCMSAQCFVALNNEDFDARDVLILLRKFKTGDFDGIAKYVGFGAELKTAFVHTLEEKKHVLSTIEDYIQNLGEDPCDHRFAEYARRTCELLDELVLNAVFDANPRFQQSPRNEPFLLSESESVIVTWGFDGEIFGLSVTDRFGLLGKETIVRYLDETFDQGDMQTRKSGGLGLKLIFERLHQFIVNVQPGQKTEIICLSKFERRLKDFDNKLRSFHFFSTQGK